mmetsp:Transcript_112861/g.364489  ORF Transcript_112861/g.364489 Transcript_112861/m.364489 type:complete len:192 (-) Transcript_112861:175-750(-)
MGAPGRNSESSANSSGCMRDKLSGPSTSAGSDCGEPKDEHLASSSVRASKVEDSTIETSPCSAPGDEQIDLSRTSRRMRVVNKKLYLYPATRLNTQKSSDQMTGTPPPQMASQPPDDQLATPSMDGSDGSACKACMFFFTAAGCTVGESCKFCHLSHEHESRSRPSKARRSRYRKLIANQLQEVGVQPQYQ